MNSLKSERSVLLDKRMPKLGYFLGTLSNMVCLYGIMSILQYIRNTNSLMENSIFIQSRYWDIKKSTWAKKILRRNKTLILLKQKIFLKWNPNYLNYISEHFDFSAFFVDSVSRYIELA